MPKLVCNEDIVGIFEKMSRVLSLKGENRFRIIAYENAARSIRELDEDLPKIAAQGKLEEISGIGKDLAGKTARRAQRHTRRRAPAPRPATARNCAGSAHSWERIRDAMPSE